MKELTRDRQLEARKRGRKMETRIEIPDSVRQKLEAFDHLREVHSQSLEQWADLRICVHSLVT